MVELMAAPEFSRLLLELHDQPDALATLRRFLDRYLHRARNRLNTIRLGLYMARRNLGRDHESIREIERSYEQVQRFLEHFQRFMLPIELSPVEGSLGQFLQDRVQAHCRRSTGSDPIRPEFEVRWDGLDHPRRFDPNRLGSALDEYLLAVAAARPRNRSIGFHVAEQDAELHVAAFESTGAPLAPSPPEAARLSPCNLAMPWLARMFAAHGARFESCPSNKLLWLARWPS